MLQSQQTATTLNNGIKMPLLGAGTYRAGEDSQAQQTVRWAIELGYRSIDTASVYENETSVGQAIADSDVPREELFVTSKVWNDDQGYDETLRAFDASLQRLQQPQLIDFCRQHAIQIEAWSPLMKGKVFEMPELKRIGDQYCKSAGQVTLRWQIQRGIATIPKSVKRERLQANADIFDFALNDDDVQAINALDQNYRVGPDPHTFPE